MSRGQNFCLIMNDWTASARRRDDTVKRGPSILLVHMDCVVLQSQCTTGCVDNDAICFYRLRDRCCMSHDTSNAQRYFFSRRPKLEHIATRGCIAGISHITNGCCLLWGEPLICNLVAFCLRSQNHSGNFFIIFSDLVVSSIFRILSYDNNLLFARLTLYVSRECVIRSPKGL